MTEDLDVAKAPPVMRHIIRELLEPAGLNLWSQQASAAQGYNVLCSKWASLLWEVYFWTLQSVWVLFADCTMERYRHGLRESINQMWIHTLDTCSALKPSCHPAEVSFNETWNPIQLFLWPSQTRASIQFRFTFITIKPPLFTCLFCISPCLTVYRRSAVSSCGSRLHIPSVQWCPLLISPGCTWGC